MAARPPREPASIEEWRDAIDAIDDAILGLLNERAECAIAIGRLKRVERVEIYQPAREAEVLRRVAEANRGPLNAEAVRRLFERIIDESRSIERVVVGEDSPELTGRGDSPELNATGVGPRCSREDDAPRHEDDEKKKKKER